MSESLSSLFKKFATMSELLLSHFKKGDVIDLLVIHSFAGKQNRIFHHVFKVFNCFSSFYAQEQIVPMAP